MNMKKLLLLSVASFVLFTANAQVQNTGETLKAGTFTVGIDPTIIAEGDNDFILYGNFGYGLKKGIDLNGRIGVLGPGDTYIGADVEFALGSKFSFSAGAHSYGDFGLDGTFLATFGLGKSADFYVGFDADFNFGDEVYVPLWIPVGVEIGVRKNMSFLLEADIAATDEAYHMITGGLNFYF